MPMMAVPALARTMRTSAKSVLIWPGMVMRSVMPWTPCSSTSSAILNAFTIDVFSVDTVRSRSLGMMMMASTFSFRFWMPASAWTERRRPFEGEGPGDHADGERADGTWRSRPPPGRRPVPVPPPLPAVMKTMSAPLSASSISARCSSAACAADLGVAPGPEPPGQLPPDVELQVGVAHEQRLRVGVDGDELDALQPGLDHPVHGVDAAAADAHHLDDSEVAALRWTGHRLSSTIDPNLGPHRGNPARWSGWTALRAPGDLTLDHNFIGCVRGLPR